MHSFWTTQFVVNLLVELAQAVLDQVVADHFNADCSKTLDPCFLNLVTLAL